MIGIIVSLIILFFLVILMFLILKKLVKKVNDDSKLYFTLKLQEYDELIKEREEKLKSTKVEVESNKQENVEESSKSSVVVLNQELPKYQIEDLFKISKKIDNKFKIDSEKIINSFIQNHPISEFTDTILKLQEYLKKIDKYKLVIGDEVYKNKVIGDLKDIDKGIVEEYFDENNKSDIFELINYLNIKIKQNDTTIYVEVGERNINYNYLSNRIKTIYNPQISKGIIIIYQNQKFDYSLN